MDVHLQQLIIRWWKKDGPARLNAVYRVVPQIMVWMLWKRRNGRRYDKDSSLNDLIYQCDKLIYYFIKVRFPGIQIPNQWEGMVRVLLNYKPKLLYQPIVWNIPQSG